MKHLKNLKMQHPLWLLLFIVGAAAANVHVFCVGAGLVTGETARLGGWLCVAGQFLSSAVILIGALRLMGDRDDPRLEPPVLLLSVGLLLALFGSWLVMRPDRLWGWLETVMPPVMMLMSSLLGGLILVGGPGGLPDREE